MTVLPEWGPGELEAECARLQHLEERVEALASAWEQENWVLHPTPDYFIRELRNVLREAITKGSAG